MAIGIRQILRSLIAIFIGLLIIRILLFATGYIYILYVFGKFSIEWVVLFSQIQYLIVPTVAAFATAIIGKKPEFIYGLILYLIQTILTFSFSGHYFPGFALGWSFNIIWPAGFIAGGVLGSIFIRYSSRKRIKFFMDSAI